MGKSIFHPSPKSGGVPWSRTWNQDLVISSGDSLPEQKTNSNKLSLVQPKMPLKVILRKTKDTGKSAYAVKEAGAGKSVSSSLNSKPDVSRTSDVLPQQFLNTRSRTLEKPLSSFKMFVNKRIEALKKKGVFGDEASDKAVEMWNKLSTEAKEKLQKKYDENMKKYNKGIAAAEKKVGLKTSKKAPSTFYTLPLNNYVHSNVQKTTHACSSIDLNGDPDPPFLPTASTAQQDVVSSCPLSLPSHPSQSGQNSDSEGVCKEGAGSGHHQEDPDSDSDRDRMIGRTFPVTIDKQLSKEEVAGQFDFRFKQEEDKSKGSDVKEVKRGSSTSELSGVLAKSFGLGPRQLITVRRTTGKRKNKDINTNTFTEKKRKLKQGVVEEAPIRSTTIHGKPDTQLSKGEDASHFATKFKPIKGNSEGKDEETLPEEKVYSSGLGLRQFSRTNSTAKDEQKSEEGINDEEKLTVPIINSKEVETDKNSTTTDKSNEYLSNQEVGINFEINFKQVSENLIPTPTVVSLTTSSSSVTVTDSTDSSTADGVPSQNYICDICKRVFSSLFWFQKHTAKCQVRYQCDKCKVILKNEKNLKEHLHNFHDAIGFACERCDEKFFTNNKLERHIRKKHGEPKVCPLCSAKLKNKACLKKHMKKNCRSKRPLDDGENCEKTGENVDISCSSKNSSNKGNNMIDKHPSISSIQLNTSDNIPSCVVEPTAKPRIKCEFCHKTYQTRNGLRKHKKTHTTGIGLGPVSLLVNEGSCMTIDQDMQVYVIENLDVGNQNVIVAS